MTQEEVVQDIEDMRTAAMLYATQMDGWSTDIGLFFHVFGHCSVNSLHMHILDMSKCGPSYQKLSFKNCPVDNILKVLKEEMDAKSSSKFQVTRSATAATQTAQAALSQVVDMTAGGEGITVEQARNLLGEDVRHEHERQRGAHHGEAGEPANPGSGDLHPPSHCPARCADEHAAR